jgi:protein SCO1/2
MRRRVWLGAAVAAVLAGGAGVALAGLAATRAPDAAAPLAAAGVDEHLGAQLPLELGFTGPDGAPVRLGDAFRDGKPVVLSLAYFHCTMLCPLVLRGAATRARESTPRPGADYHLLTVSIDPRDRPADAAKARSDLFAMTRPGARGWRFWTGGEESIAALADALGFRYHYDPRSDQFAHAAVLFVLTPQGRVSRYLYGVDVPRAQFEAALAAAAKGETGSSFERILLRCFHYVPALRRYGAAVAQGLRGAGLLIVLTVAGGLALLTRGVRRRSES